MAIFLNTYLFVHKLATALFKEVDNGEQMGNRTFLKDLKKCSFWLSSLMSTKKIIMPAPPQEIGISLKFDVVHDNLNLRQHINGSGNASSAIGWVLSS